MKNILVPTDFSENAKSAFLYALALAEQIRATVTVVHVYHPTANAMNEYMVFTDNKLEEIFAKRLGKFVEKNLSKFNKEVMVADLVELKLEAGFATDKLVEMSKSGEYDLLVMGVTGATGLFEKVFGKISQHVAQWSGCPVLLIPAVFRFVPINDIMYASEYDSANVNVLLQLQEFSEKFNANIHLVHVYDKVENQPEGIGHFLLEKAFQLKAPTLKFTMESVTSDSVAHGLEKYAVHHHMDWMVLVKPQHKLWKRLIYKSETNEMVMNPLIPLMVMH